MVSVRGRERGTSTLGCLFSALVFCAAAYYGVHVGGIYWRFYQLKDDMQQQAIFARQNTDEIIRARLTAQADSLLGSSPAFRIARGGRHNVITIETEYSESVDLPLLKKTFVLRPRVEEPL
ncbi:MAG: hypothetical protein ACTHM9_05775 [Gemmatimonadales bacterium]